MQRYKEYYGGAKKSDDGNFVLYDDAQALITAKDAEIERLKELQRASQGAIAGLTEQERAKHEHIESLESKCAKMRELLGECAELMEREGIDGPFDGDGLAARIDAILESEEA